MRGIGVSYSAEGALTARVVGLLSMLGLAWWLGGYPFQGSSARADELSVPPTAPSERFEFEQKVLEGWRSINGQWALEEMAGAPSGKRVLVQRAVQNAFNVIVAPGGPYRVAAGRYYLVRANALENNFRLYAYDRGRQQLASATVEPPALGQWHTVRVVPRGCGPWGSQPSRPRPGSERSLGCRWQIR